MIEIDCKMRGRERRIGRRWDRPVRAQADPEPWRAARRRASEDGLPPLAPGSFDKDQCGESPGEA